MTVESKPPAVHVHAVIRRGGGFLMLHSENFAYYKFSHGEQQPDETPEQALSRIVSAQTGLTVRQKGIRPLLTVNAERESGAVQVHAYYICKAEGALSAEGDRFRPVTVSRGAAIAVNAQSDHGMLSDDVRFRAVLEREALVLRSVRRFSPVQLSIMAIAGSVLIPLIGGLSCMLFGFHSPTDGGTVTGTDGFIVGAFLGCFPALPAAAVSVICLLLSLKDRRKAAHKPAAYILPLFALAVILFLAWAVYSIGG